MIYEISETKKYQPSRLIIQPDGSAVLSVTEIETVDNETAYQGKDLPLNVNNLPGFSGLFEAVFAYLSLQNEIPAGTLKLEE